MFNLSAYTTDDRGKRVPVFSARGQPAVRFEGDPELRAILERLAKTEQLGLHERITRHHLLTASPIILLPLAIVLMNSLLPGLPPLANGAAIAVIMLMAAPLFAMAGNAGRAARTRATLLREGRCPSCAYALEGTTPEPDRRLTCPECGSAWDAAAVGRPPPSPPMSAPRSSMIRTYTSRACAIDDLNRVIGLRDPLLRDLEPARAAELGEARINEVRAAVRSGTRQRRVTTTIFQLLLLVFVAGTQLLVAFAWPGPARPAPAAMGALFTFFFSMQIYRSLTYRSRSTALPAARVLIEHGLCPSCAGDLTLDPASSRIACPGCGAVWNSAGP